MSPNRSAFLAYMLIIAALSGAMTFGMITPGPTYAAEQKAGRPGPEAAPSPALAPAATASTTPAPIATTPPATPEKAPVARPIQEKMPVSVEFQGTDGIGQRLVYHLKEVFEKSAIFRLSGKDEKKIKVLVSTAEEFAGRPNTSSVFSVVWLYSENEGTLKYYLAATVGLVHAATVKESAEELAGRTHDIVTGYGYLFE